MLCYDENHKLYIEKFEGIETPFYYYDMGILRKTLDTMTSFSKPKGFQVHYAIKANFNPVLLKVLKLFKITTK